MSARALAVISMRLYSAHSYIYIHTHVRIYLYGIRATTTVSATAHNRITARNYIREEEREREKRTRESSCKTISRINKIWADRARQFDRARDVQYDRERAAVWTLKNLSRQIGHTRAPPELEYELTFFPSLSLCGIGVLHENDDRALAYICNIFRRLCSRAT